MQQRCSELDSKADKSLHINIIGKRDETGMNISIFLKLHVKIPSLPHIVAAQLLAEGYVWHFKADTSTISMTAGAS